MAGPEGDQLIYVDMTNESVSIEPFPAEWKLFGGRGLSAKILTQQCDPTCDPLGPDNVLVLAPGVMSGTTAPTSGRISVGCKSPLTGGIKEANAGGNPGQHLMKLGIRAIVVKGQPADATSATASRSTPRARASSRRRRPTRACGTTRRATKLARELQQERVVRSRSAPPAS